MRYLCIDLGDKRTGLAIGDIFTRIATPLTVLEVPITDNTGEALLNALVQAINDQFSPHAEVGIVIGLPLNMHDGSEGPRSKVVRDFASRLEARLGQRRKIHFQDERLSSVQADWTMAQSGLTHKQKKQRRDALAAASILSDFLKSFPTSQNNDPESEYPETS